MNRIVVLILTKGGWALAAFLAFSMGVAYTPSSVAADATAPPGGTIAYALYDLHWATYQAKDTKQECPDGFNRGNRYQFSELFPQDGQKYTLLQGQLRREIDIWWPTTAPDKFPFLYATGPTALGMNLDGKIGPNDFTSPDGEKGIDNQLYRAIGCINGYQHDGNNDFFDNSFAQDDRYDRLVIVLTGVDSLVNSPHVEVTVARGLDPLLTDATGKDFVPGGTQKIDFRWGAPFIRHLQGKITNGVLTTEPEDIAYPWASFGVPTYEYMRAARFRLKLTPKNAEGMLAGYTDVDTFYVQTIKNHSTHDASYGQLSESSLYKALHQVADAYPDPKTGENTAASSALLVKFVQVFILPDSQSKLVAFEPKRYVAAYEGVPFPRPAAEQAREPGVPISTNKVAAVPSAGAALAKRE